MGTMTKRIKDLRDKRTAYHEQMKKKEMLRVASYLQENDRHNFMTGEGFIVLPEQERLRLRIDTYPYLR